MAKLIYSATASLDGFIAGPGADMTWLSPFAGEGNPTADRLLAQVGAILAGGGTMRGSDPNEGTDAEGAFGGRYAGATFALTSRPPEPAWPGVEVHSDLDEAVAAASAAAGDRYVSILGATLARSCLERGLLDEVLLFHVPVFLGDGVRVFDRPGGARVALEPIAEETEHWYRVAR